MTETVIRLLNADICAFSQVEAEVLRRVSEADKITSISSEMGFAEPIVKEYIRSLLRKVRMRDVERTTGLEYGGAMPTQELLEVLLGGTDTRLQSLGGRPRPARWNQLNWSR